MIDTFGVSISQSQVLLFVNFFFSAAGVLLGGMLGDRTGRLQIIGLFVLGPPASDAAFAACRFRSRSSSDRADQPDHGLGLRFDHTLCDGADAGRIGLVGGVFYGLNFTIGGVSAAILGALADSIGLHQVFMICSILPLVGVVTWLLPKNDRLGTLELGLLNSGYF